MIYTSDKELHRSKLLAVLNGKMLPHPCAAFSQSLSV